jgi:anti-sigma regulatory factor (Ser/Thr protein kinase)
VTAVPEAGRRGNDHQAFCHSSDDEVLAVAVPFLRAGLLAGEPTVVSLEPRRAELIYEAVPDSAGLTFVPAGDLYARPASVIKAYRKRMVDYVAAGAAGIRIIGELPPVAFGYSWDWWARYESAVNHAYAEFPVRTLCAYDTRIVPPHVLDDVRRTHPLVTGTGGVSTAAYIEPRAFLTAPWPVPPHPVQLRPPQVDLVDPEPSAARRAVTEANRTALAPDALDDLVLSVSEVVTNAHRHGRGPVRMRLWSDASHAVVTVQDTGSGPADPFAGLLPAPDRATGGLGLWLAHQLCEHVAMVRDEDGFTVRLTAGRLPR